MEKLFKKLFFFTVAFLAGASSGYFFAQKEKEVLVPLSALNMKMLTKSEETKKENTAEQEKKDSELQNHQLTNLISELLELELKGDIRNYTKVINLSKKILELDEDNGEALYNLGNYSSLVGDKKKTFEFFQECVYLNKRFRPCRNRLATIAYYELPTSEGQEVIKECLDDDPDNSYCHYFLAKIDTDNNRFDLAIKYFKNQLSENPALGRVLTFDEIHYELGDIYKQSGQKEASLQHFLQSCKMGNESACKMVKN